MNRNRKSKFIVFVVLSVSIIFPILNLFRSIELSQVSALLTSDSFMSFIINSVTTTLMATIISVSLALVV